MNKKINWKSVSLFVDIDTGEILKITNERQLKYTNYIVIKKTKKTEINESNGIIRITNECRHTGQREIDFKE